MAQQGEAADRVVRVREALASLASAIVAQAAWLLSPWRWPVTGRARDLFLAWRQAAAEQRYLADLSDHDLRDLGLSREDVARPPSQFFWRQ